MMHSTKGFMGKGVKGLMGWKTTTMVASRHRISNNQRILKRREDKNTLAQFLLDWKVWHQARSWVKSKIKQDINMNVAGKALADCHFHSPNMRQAYVHNFSGQICIYYGGNLSILAISCRTEWKCRLWTFQACQYYSKFHAKVIRPTVSKTM